jgi:hypothetical protein
MAAVAGVPGAGLIAGAVAGAVDPAKGGAPAAAGGGAAGGAPAAAPSKPAPVATKEYKDSLFYKCYGLINNDKKNDYYYN